MTQFAFAMFSLFGVPCAIVAVLLLAHRLTPPAIWQTRAVQAFATLALLACIGLPVAIMWIDSQGEFFDDETVLVRQAFGLPEGVMIERQGDKTLRLGDCWRNAVNWQADAVFDDPAAFDRWYAAAPYRDGIMKQVSNYFGQTPAQMSVAPGALDLHERGAQYVLSDKAGSYARNTRILDYYEPFVCAAIERGTDGSISLRRCDSVAERDDTGNAGRVIIRPNVKKRTLKGQIFYASGPSYCTNPLRRAVNGVLGLPHPEGGLPNTAINGALPIG